MTHKMRSPYLVLILILGGSLVCCHSYVDGVQTSADVHLSLLPDNLDLSRILLNKTWGGTGTDIGFGIIQLEKNFYLTGTTYSFGNGTPDYPNAYVVKLNQQGDEIWNISWGGKEPDGAYAIATIDDAILISGYTYSYGFGTPLESNAFLLKISQDGVEMWNRTYSFNNKSAVATSMVVFGHEIYLAGRVAQGSFSDAFLLKINKNGDILWEKRWGGFYDDSAFGVTAFNNEVCITGWTNSYGMGTPAEPNAFIACYNLQGDKIWDDIRGGNYWDTAWSIAVINDTIFIAGETQSYSPAPGKITNAFICSYDANGTLRWESSYGGASETRALSIIPSMEKSVFFVGSIEKNAQRDVLLESLNYTTGKMIEKVVWGGKENDAGFAAVSNQSCILITGGTSSFGNGTPQNPDTFLISVEKGSPPMSPLNLTANGGDQRVFLFWEAPASDGGLPILNYIIYRGMQPGEETFLVMVGDVLNYTDMGVTNGQTYYYQVSAVNSIGEGPRSNEVNATPSGIVNTPPVADFTFSPLFPTISDVIQFTDSSHDSDGMIVSWLWDFGDGTHSTEKNPRHQFTVAGEYQVNLTVTDDKGARCSTIKKISVQGFTGESVNQISIAAVIILIVVIAFLTLSLFLRKKRLRTRKQNPKPR